MSEQLTARPESVPAGGHRTWLLVAATPLILMFTYDVAFVAHEYGHSFTAWITGIKSSPWPIHWGGASFGNLVFLDEVDEHVDYDAAAAAGKYLAIAQTAIAGISVNFLLYLIMRFAAAAWRTSTRPIVAYTAFWFLFMQIGNLFCYVPVRVASPTGDMHNFVWGSGLSYWWLYVIIGYFVLWAIVDLYRTVLPISLDTSRIDRRGPRAVVLVIATVVLFGYFAGPGLDHGDISLFVVVTSLLLIPVVIVVNWQRVTRPTPPVVLPGVNHESRHGVRQLPLCETGDTTAEAPPRSRS